MLLKTLTLKEPLQRFAVKSLKGQKRTLKHYKQSISLYSKFSIFSYQWHLMLFIYGVNDF